MLDKKISSKDKNEYLYNTQREIYQSSSKIQKADNGHYVSIF